MEKEYLEEEIAEDEEIEEEDSVEAEPVNIAKRFLDNDFKGSMQIIKDYLIGFGSKDPLFKDRLEASTQTANQLEQYLIQEARKQASGGSMAMVDNKVVFGWAVHFIDENIKIKEKTIAQGKIKEAVQTPKPINKTIVKADVEQLSLF